jgi:stage IV sporulation protein FB
MFQFRIRGILIECHITFILLLIVISLIGSGLLALSSFFFSLLHEFSHAWIARKKGYTPLSISIGLFGGVLHIKERDIKPKDAMIIYIAGPLLNLLFALGFYLLLLQFPSHWLSDIVAANILLALFNLMPFYPLDGGKIVKLYLSYFLGQEKANTLSRIFSLMFSVLLFIFGIYMIQYNSLNLLISLLAINLYVAGRADSRYSFSRLQSIYKALEEENRIWD